MVNVINRGIYLPTNLWGYYYKKHRGGSMRVAILPYIILTEGHRAAVSIMVKGLSTASEVFLIFTTQLYQY